MRSSEQPHADIVSVPVPPPDARPYVPHIKLPGNRETAFVALHVSVAGFLMHWVNNQHEPHVQNVEWCAGCRQGQTPRWTGFVGVISLNTRNRFVLSIPSAAFRESGEFRDRSDAAKLVGCTFTSYRFGKREAANNPAVIEMLDAVQMPPLGQPFPLLAALSRYWRRPDLEGIQQVSRPEDSQTKLAEGFTGFSEKWLANRAKRKGAQP